MGQIVAGLPGVKGKFHYLHSRIAKFQLHLPDLVCNVAKIFCDEIQIRQSFSDCPKKIHSRPFQPGAVFRSVLSCRDGPVTLKSPEMVKPNHVIKPGGHLQAANPPTVPGVCHSLPVKQGISPKLSVCRKGIGRTACYQLGAAPFIQLKQRGVCPYIRGVQRNIYGDISNNPDAFFIGITAQGFPLAGENILLEEVLLDLSR